MSRVIVRRAPRADASLRVRHPPLALARARRHCKRTRLHASTASTSS